MVERLKMSKPEISVIIPACNEAETIGDVIQKIKELYPDFEIIVINDGSTDDTGLISKEAGAIVYSHPYNIGNGAVPHASYLELEADEVVKMAGGPVAVVDCFGILDDDRIRRYFELGCEVKALGRGHIQRIKEEIRKARKK